MFGWWMKVGLNNLAECQRNYVFFWKKTDSKKYFSFHDPASLLVSRWVLLTRNQRLVKWPTQRLGINFGHRLDHLENFLFKHIDTYRRFLYSKNHFCFHKPMWSLTGFWGYPLNDQSKTENPRRKPRRSLLALLLPMRSGIQLRNQTLPYESKDHQFKGAETARHG